MKKERLQSLVAEAAGVDVSAVTTKKRAGNQISANGLWEGSCTPSSPRAAVGLMLALSQEESALEGALRRMRSDLSDLPFPEAVILVEKPGKQERRAKVFGYDDSSVGKKAADALSAPFESVARPSFIKSSLEASNPGASHEIESARLLHNLRQIPNVVLQGPPGTGKSSAVLSLIGELAETDGSTAEQCRYGNLLSQVGGNFNNLELGSGAVIDLPIVWEFVQLHPGYAYEDLVRRIVPGVGSAGQLQMRVEDGILPKLCEIAAARGDAPVLLVLDEINRANLAAVLGEFVFAIDPSHRGRSVRLQYQGDGVKPTVSVPPNLWIVGTMNTADRSLALVDYAVRRRFRFLDMTSDEEVVTQWYRQFPEFGNIARSLMVSCNGSLPERLHVAHALFLESPIPISSWPGRIARKVAYQVLPLLIEYEKEGLSREQVEIDGVVISKDDRKKFMFELEDSIKSKLGMA